MRSRNQVPSLTLASNSWANLPDGVIEKCFGCVHEGVIVADMLSMAPEISSLTAPENSPVGGLGDQPFA